MSHIIAIDPSINNCGFALFNDEDSIVSPITYRLITPKHLIANKKEKFFYIRKAKYIFEDIRDTQKDFDNCKIILEVPEYQGSSAFEARESSSIAKLSYICGMICTLDNVIPYTPTQWKGQVSKQVMQNRLNLKIPDIDMIKIDHNIADAIGIGYYYITKLSKK